MMRCNLLWALLVLGACTPTPPAPQPPPPPPDASDAATAIPGPYSVDCARACAQMAAVGCREGRVATCPKAMTESDADRLIRLPSGQSMTCGGCAGARTPADVVALCASSCTP